MKQDSVVEGSAAAVQDEMKQTTSCLPTDRVSQDSSESADQTDFCYAEGDEGSQYCGDPKRMHCVVLGDAVTVEHMVACMRDRHFIHHSFVPAPPITRRPLGLYAVFYGDETRPVAGFVLKHDAEWYARRTGSGDVPYKIRHVHVIDDTQPTKSAAHNPEDEEQDES